MSENEQLHMQLQEATDENESLKQELQQYLPDAYNLKEMTIEQKLRNRVQELEDLVTEMKQQAGPAKLVELQNQLQSLTLELADLQRKNKELNAACRKLQDGQKPIVINGQDAVDYYAMILREKDEELEMLKKNRDQAKGFEFLQSAQ